jgi:hypothetical protein
MPAGGILDHDLSGKLAIHADLWLLFLKVSAKIRFFRVIRVPFLPPLP